METALNQTAERLGGSFAEIESRRHELAAMLDSMQEAVVAITPEGNVRWSNAVMQRIAGTQIHPGRPLIHSVRDPDLLACIRGALHDGEVRFGRASSLAPGRVFEISAAPLPSGGAIAVLHDVTRIEAAEKSRRDFIANVSHDDKHPIAMLLSAYGVKTHKQATALHAAAMACPALPTCGLALAESERMLPGFLDRIEKLLAEVGLAGEEIIIRSTGCPNGCARPYMAEIGFVGKAPGRYQIWLGGNDTGTRLNRLWNDAFKEAELETTFRPVFTRFAQERTHGERFGDWCHRVLLAEVPPNAGGASEHCP